MHDPTSRPQTNIVLSTQLGYGGFNITEQAGSSKDAEFLSFKLLNKRARLKLSEESLNLGSITPKANLLAVSSSKGWLAAVTRRAGTDTLICTPLLQIHEEATSLTEEKAATALQPQRAIPLPAPATAIAFAHRDSRFCVAFNNGSLAIYDSAALCSDVAGPVSPLYVHESNNAGPIIDLAPNPEGMSELVAIIRSNMGPSSGFGVELLNLDQNNVVASWECGDTADTTMRSMAWSPKGKQIAFGLHSGGLVSFSPQDARAPKIRVPPPPSLQGCALISLNWLSNDTFHGIYVAAGNSAADAEQIHFIMNTDGKTTASFTKLDAPYMSFPALRPPGSFVSVLKDWDPSKYILVAGDSTSSDIGVIGHVDGWSNLSLDEGSTPTLPLDSNMEDTVLVGLQLDFTTAAPYNHTTAGGTTVEIPPPPVLYAYASDGTLQAWHIVNSSGAKYVPPLPGGSANAIQSIPSIAMSDATDQGNSDMADTPISRSPAPAEEAMETAKDEPKTAEPASTQGLGFGGMSLGGSHPDNSASKPSLFGSFGNSSAPAPTPAAFGTTPAPGSGSFGTSNGFSSGFGAFSGGTPSSFSQPSAFSSKPAASAFGGGASAFGQSGFGQSAFGQSAAPAAAATSSAFGSSGFGGSTTAPTQSAFGQTAFGQTSAFGKPAASTFGQPSSSFSQSAFGSSSGGGGFSAFASSGTSLSGGTTPAVEKKDTPPATPGPAPSTPPSMPSTPKPTEEKKSTFAPSDTTTPSSSPFTSSSNNAAFSAFSNLQTTPNAFKPSSGFGAFGSTTPVDKSSSPFSSKPATSAFGSTTTSAFGGGPGASTTPSGSPAVTAAPAFGATSTFGAKSAFGSTSPFGTPSKPGTTAFGTTSAFGAKSAFASATSDLKTTTPEPAKGGFGSFTSTTSAFGQAASSAGSGFGALLRDAGSDKGKGKGKDADKSSEPPKAEAKSMNTDPKKEDEDNVDTTKDSQKPRTLQKEESLSNISQLSASYEKIEREDESPTEDNEEGDNEEDGESFLSGDLTDREDDEESISDGPPEDPTSEHEDGEEESDEDAQGTSDEDEEESEVNSSLPPPSWEETTPRKAEPTRPTSTTPKDASPTIPQTTIPPSPAPSRTPFSFTAATPPGSPDENLAKSNVLPKTSPPTESIVEKSGLFAKPTSKPLRSSPLATGQVISPGDNEEPAAPPKPSLFSGFGSFPRSDFPAAKAPSPAFGTSVQAEANAAPAPAPFTLGARPALGKPASSFNLGSLSEASKISSPFTLAAKPELKAPLPSFGAAPKSASPSPSSSPLPSPSPFGLPSKPSFGGESKPSPFGGFSAPSSTASPFNLNAASDSAKGASPFTLQAATGATSPFGTPSISPALTSSTPFAAGGNFAAPPTATLSLSKPSTPAPFSLGIGQPPPLRTAPALAAPPKPTKPLTGLEAACHELLSSVDASFDELRAATAPPAHTLQQITQHGRSMDLLRSDVEEVRDTQQKVKRSVEQLDRDMLKVLARKEEIARFNKARTDQSFARMLKSRTLGPDHIEMQTQLRRDIRTIRDRVKKLELYVDGGKKRLSMVKKGKPALKASSLDMVNRTMNNIEIAITQDKQDITALTRRIARLNLKVPSAREQTSGQNGNEASLVPSTSVAAVTAAALNAERASLKLKVSLLSVRKEPLHNKVALIAMPTTPAATNLPSASTPNATMSLFPSLPAMPFTLPAQSLDSTFLPLPPSGDDSFSPLADAQSLSTGPNRRGGNTKHLKPVALKKSPGPAAPPASFASPSAFAWGPLPPMSTPPRTNLAFDVRGSPSPGR